MPFPYHLLFTNASAYNMKKQILFSVTTAKMAYEKGFQEAKMVL